jgi:cytochrome P450
MHSGPWPREPVRCPEAIWQAARRWYRYYASHGEADGEPRGADDLSRPIKGAYCVAHTLGGETDVQVVMTQALLLPTRMTVSEQYEAPRLRLISPRLAPPAELTRWLLERRRIPYVEQPQATVFHAFHSMWHGVDAELPLLLTREGPKGGVLAALDVIDRRCRSGERVYGESEEECAAAREWIELFHRQVFGPAVRLFYFHALGTPRFLRSIATLEAPFWQKAAVRCLFPLWKRLLIRGLKLDGFDSEAACASIAGAFDRVESHLGAERRFLAGDEPGTVDIVFAALATPVTLPAGFGAQAPRFEELPAPLQAVVQQFRGRRGGQLVDAVYEHARPAPQPRLRAAKEGPSLRERLVSPAVLRLLARLLVKRAPRISLGRTLILSRWKDVTEVLDRDNEYLIEPINKRRIEAVSGPFILGMDRSARLFEQREQVYAALRAADKQPFFATLEQESLRLLKAAADAGGRIDVVNGYARLVACRTAVALFGIRGPTEQDLLRAARALFHETFLNQNDAPNTTRLGLAAGREMRQWIVAELQDRIDRNAPGHDVLGHLLSSLGPEQTDEARWIIGGLLVGAIDTTATAVANIILEVVSDARLKSDMQRDADDPKQFAGWCWEALRRRPHNPALLRQAGPHASLGGAPIAEGTRVLLFTLAAMHDPSAFDRPGVLNPRRPADRYLHFGHGLHACAGRDFNAVQIPRLVRELVRRDVSGPTTFRTRGPFPDTLVVSIGKDSS